MIRHTDSRYEEELATIARSAYTMGLSALGMVESAVRALLERDGALARSVVRADDALDAAEIEVDRLCLHLIVRRSPVGEDVRLVLAVSKLVTDIERIGDLAVNIAERSLELLAAHGDGPPPEVAELASRAIALLSGALDAFNRRDARAARALFELDREIDAMNRAAFAELLRHAEGHPHEFSRAMSLANICKHLERVGDHAVNIGERVVFLVEGEDLRHAQA